MKIRTPGGTLRTCAYQAGDFKRVAELLIDMERADGYGSEFVELIGDPDGSDIEWTLATARRRPVALGGLLQISDELAALMHLGVHPQRRRRGFGQALLGELERQASSEGCGWLRLTLLPQQAAAKRFFERAGYEIVGTRSIGALTLLDYLKALEPRR